MLWAGRSLEEPWAVLLPKAISTNKARSIESIHEITTFDRAGKVIDLNFTIPISTAISKLRFTSIYRP